MVEDGSGRLRPCTKLCIFEVVQYFRHLQKSLFPSLRHGAVRSVVVPMSLHKARWWWRLQHSLESVGQQLPLPSESKTSPTEKSAFSVASLVGCLCHFGVKQSFGCPDWVLLGSFVHTLSPFRPSYRQWRHRLGARARVLTAPTLGLVMHLHSRPTRWSWLWPCT